MSQLDRMPEREFRSWVRYASTRLMPGRRMEAYLAQIASVIAQTSGNDMSLSDFLLDFKPKGKKMKSTADAYAIANFAKRGVRKLGQGRK